MDGLDYSVLRELGAKVGSLEVENAYYKARLEHAIQTAEALAERLKKYENEEGVPHGDNPKKES